MIEANIATDPVTSQLPCNPLVVTRTTRCYHYDSNTRTEVFAPNKYETSSDIVTNKKSGSIEPKMERVPNNTIFYIQTPSKT